MRDDKSLPPIALAILAKCHVNGGCESLSAISSWLCRPVDQIVQYVMNELQGHVVIDGDTLRGKIGGKREKADKVSIPCMTNELMAMWNARVGGTRIPKVRVVSDSNQKAINARWSFVFNLLRDKLGREPNEGEMLGWFDGFMSYVFQSKFLSGRKTEWRATFVWCFNANNFSKIMNKDYE